MCIYCTTFQRGCTIIVLCVFSILRSSTHERPRAPHGCLATLARAAASAPVGKDGRLMATSKNARGQQRHNTARLSFVSKRAIKRSQMTKICHHINSTPSGTQITDRFNQEKQKATTGTLMSEIRPCMAKALPSQTSL